MGKPALPAAPADLTFVSPRATKEITSLSTRQQDRLEADGRFPRSVKLGEGRNGRKARVLAEVLEWTRARIAERDGQAA